MERQLGGTLGAVTKALLKATPGTVFAIYASNGNAAVRYLLLHEKATAPAAADVPVRAWRIPIGGDIRLGPNELCGGIRMVTGMGWSVSSTFATFTDAATATDHLVQIDYI